MNPTIGYALQAVSVGALMVGTPAGVNTKA
ncbi:MAG: hypothetical protein K0S56_2292 [Microvirga sp.]|jgi:hypothetical protein|nr:hypothetical protein [Microvirga sp.]